MAKVINPLTDTHPRNAKPKEKPYKLADGRGLHLLVSPSGAKYWRMNYRFDVIARIWHNKRTSGDNHTKPWTMLLIWGWPQGTPYRK